MSSASPNSPTTIERVRPRPSHFDDDYIALLRRVFGALFGLMFVLFPALPMAAIDWASWVTAVATFMLAAVGAITLRANAALIRAATDEAQASQALVQETQIDRRLAAQPFLTFQHNPTVGQSFRIDIENIGRGPAIACLYVGYYSWPQRETGQPVRAEYVSDVFALGADRGTVTSPPIHRVSRDLDLNPASPYHRLYASHLRGALEETIEVVICRDQFGNQFHFRRGEPLPEIHLAPPGSGLPTDPVPAWAQGWPAILSARPDDAPSLGRMFAQAMATSPTRAHYATIVIGSAPEFASEFSDVDKVNISDWLRSLNSKAAPFVTSKSEVEYRATPEDSDVPNWVGRVIPGPVMSVRSAMPITPGANPQWPLLPIMRFWHQSLISAPQLLDSLCVHCVYVGLAITAPLDSIVVALDFAPVDAPQQAGQPTRHGAWTQSFGPFTPDAMDPDIIVRALTELCDTYSYVNVSGALSSLMARTQNG